MPAKWTGRLVLARWQLERPMYNFKNSFSPAFVYIHRAKYVASRDMFCLPHFWAKIHEVRGKASRLINEYAWKLKSLRTHPWKLIGSFEPIGPLKIFETEQFWILSCNQKWCKQIWYYQILFQNHLSSNKEFTMCSNEKRDKEVCPNVFIYLHYDLVMMSRRREGMI